MKAYGGVDVQIRVSLTSALVGGERLGSRSSLFTPGESVPSTPSIGELAGPRAGLDNSEKLKFVTFPGLEIGTLSRSACSQSLYRLRYRG
jgi:hypothetical protein